MYALLLQMWRTSNCQVRTSYLPFKPVSPHNLTSCFILAIFLCTELALDSLNYLVARRPCLHRYCFFDAVTSLRGGGEDNVVAANCIDIVQSRALISDSMCEKRWRIPRTDFGWSARPVKLRALYKICIHIYICTVCARRVRRNF